MKMPKHMLLCPSCADGLKEVRNVILYKVLARKCRCENCQRQKYCDEYDVQKKEPRNE